MANKLFLLISVALLSAMAPDLSGATPFYFNIHNGKDADLVKWSRDFSLPANRKPTGYKVYRWDPTTRKWIEETTGWKCTSSEPKGGTWHVNIGRTTAAVVCKSNWLKFMMDFNTNDVGIGEEDRKYKPDQAHKKNVDENASHFDADVDNAVYYGGTMGINIDGLGLSVPANTYAYLWQVNNIAGDSITSFPLEDVSSLFDFGSLPFPHDGTIETTYLSDLDTEPGLGTADGIGLAMFTGLSSIPAISPLSWGLIGNDAIATFAGISPGDSSNVLYAFSAYGPGMPTDHLNTFISDGTAEIGNLNLDTCSRAFFIAPYCDWNTISGPDKI